MKRLILIIVGMLLAFPALAQGPTKLCIPTSSDNTNCVPIWSGNPLPITGTVTATSAATATAAAPSYVEGTANPFSQNLTGDLRTIAKQSGTWNIGTLTTVTAVTSITNPVAVTQSGTWTVQPGNTANSTPWLVTQSPATSGGLSWYFVQPAASDNHIVIKAGAGQVYNIQVTNNSATVNYLRLYNATTGFNGCNSATNIVGQWAIPASTSVAGISMSIPSGIAFATGISICVTSGYATTDTTNATASAMSVNIGYK